MIKFVYVCLFIFLIWQNGHFCIHGLAREKSPKGAVSFTTPICLHNHHNQGNDDYDDFCYKICVENVDTFSRPHNPYANSKSPWFLAVICRFLAVICGSLSVSVGSWRLYVGSWRSSAVPGGYLVLGVLLSCSGQLKLRYSKGGI